MKKKILIGIAAVVLVTAIAFVGIKTTLGDKAIALPGEEHTEKALNIQEKNVTSSQLTQPSASSSAESKESGP